MPTPTYVSLATITLGSTDSEIIFSSIPATYRDLVLVISAKMSVGKTIGARFNGDTGTNYSIVNMGGNGSTTGADAFTSSALQFFGARANVSTTIFDASILQVMDYSATDKHKTALSRGSQPNSVVDASAGRWANTAAINQISLFAFGGGSNFTVGSTFSLYGIAS
jgi:hypothetical protein